MNPLEATKVSQKLGDEHSKVGRCVTFAKDTVIYSVCFGRENPELSKEEPELFVAAWVELAGIDLPASVSQRA